MDFQQRANVPGCNCKACLFTVQNKTVTETKHSKLKRCMVHMCLINNITPPTITSTDNWIIRKCIKACHDTDNIQTEAAREYALLEIIKSLERNITPCIFDLYSTYLFEVNHEWDLVIWLEVTQYLASINLRISQNSILILEHQFNKIYSKYLEEEEEYDAQPDELALVNNICHIFSNSFYFPQHLVSKLYVIFECNDEMNANANLEQTAIFLQNVIARNDVDSFNELDRDTMIWNYQVVPIDDLSENRLRRLLYFKIRLGIPSSLHDMFNTIYCEQLIGDSSNKELMVNNFDLFNQNNPEVSELIRSNVLENNMIFASYSEWELVRLNTRILILMGKECFNDVINSTQLCFQQYRPDVNAQSFTSYILEILQFFAKENSTLTPQQRQIIETLFGTFSSHLNRNGSCFQLTKHQYESILDLALLFRSSNRDQYRTLASTLVSGFENTLHHFEEHKYLMKIFCGKWVQFLDDPNKAHSFHELFQDDNIWNQALSSELPQTTMERILILNKIISDNTLRVIFFPNGTPRYYLSYILSVTAQTNIMGYHKCSSLNQHLISFGATVNTVLDSMAQDLINRTLPSEVGTISIYFSVLTKFYAEDANESEFQVLDCYLRAILLASNEQHYHETVLKAVKLLTSKQIYLNFNSESILIQYGIFKLFNIIQHVIRNEKSDSYDFGQVLNYYQNHPLMNCIPHQNLMAEYQATKNSTSIKYNVH